MDATLLLELQTLIARHAGPDGIQRPLPGLVVATARESMPLQAYVTEPVWSLVVQGTKRLLLGEQEYTYSAGQYLIASVDLPVSGQVTATPFAGISLTLKPDAIAALMTETAAPRHAQAEPSGIAVSDAPDELLEPVLRLLRLLDRPADLPVLAPAIEREIYWRLINGPQGAMLSQLGLADSNLAQISRAIRWIREHHAEPFHIEELAGRIGMSATSFHRHFRRVTSLSPIQFQKQIRLQQARTLLLSSSQDVASIGFAVGYDSPSQFSREYRRLFGVAPGQHRHA
ncbi:helix-turn-helix domain-containing protein [Duganella sp. FT80W]|uniref:Helix-turn-helix domain-containing protein n=1 Tax=Duganella guangzhouensis TaxID=2666084 RepID=A0A6I2L2I9_9BURK|nr:AraC family transcriptional regulator [Duganella guangzhouensis]MRW92535.1 helix-turn-helix domain-containing protein [Duganella guangzhouensis]